MRISDWSSDVCSSDLSDMQFSFCAFDRWFKVNPVVKYGIKRYGEHCGKSDHWRLCQGRRSHRGNHPVLSTQGAVARTGQAIRQYSPLRSEERRVRQGCVSTSIYGWSPFLIN